MTQRDRDRLVVLKKAFKKLMTQRQAAAELGLTDRQVRRLLVRMKEVGDRAVIHGLRGRAANRKLSEDTRSQAIAVLSQEVYRGFGPTLGSEYLAKKHKLKLLDIDVFRCFADAPLECSGGLQRARLGCNQAKPSCLSVRSEGAQTRRRGPCRIP